MHAIRRIAAGLMARSSGMPRLGKALQVVGGDGNAGSCQFNEFYMNSAEIGSFDGGLTPALTLF
jgi:hypothetical protein